MRHRTIILCATLPVLFACADPTGSPSRNGLVSSRTTQPDVTANSVWAKQIVGETGPGSTYGIFVPTAWNGDAIFYAHGVRDIAEPVSLPVGDNIEVLRDALGAMGYAVAYSSFSSNGYDFDDGVRRTQQLRGLFSSVAGQPHRSYLVAHSLGSEIAEAIAERYPKQYDGAFLMCGALAGAEFEFNYIGNVRLLFDFFYPGVLPGQVNSIPIVDPISQIIVPAQTAIGANPTGAIVMLQIDQIPLGGANVNEKIQTLLRVLAAHSRFVNDLLDRVHGHFPYSNNGTIYTSLNPDPNLQGLLAVLNATIPRFTLTADARAWLDHNFQPSGAIGFPVLTMHTNRDYFIPVQTEDRFAATVAAAGNSAWLSQRTIDRYGHCAFTVPEVLTGFTDLANWVVNGVKP